MKFTQRFDISIDQEEARKMFVNRAHNRIFSGYYYKHHESDRYKIHHEISSALGDKHSYHKSLSKQVGDDFYRILLALETLYKKISIIYRSHVDELIKQIISESEIDIGIRWKNGKFVKSGAKLLDDVLVNDILHWLRENNYFSVLTPFEKGLNHFLHSGKRSDLFADVITDMYEAVEALSKIITERPNKDLSSNRELFISKVKASSGYKKLLAEYINYANEFRHAAEEEKSKPSLNPAEVESFIYLTGVFIRLAMQ